MAVYLGSNESLPFLYRHTNKNIFSSPLRPGYLRQIFVLTDGAVSNDGQVISLVKRHSHQGRLFSLGLGASASRHLVKGIARAGGGTAVFSALNEDLRPKVMSQLKNALQPAINDVKVEWLGVSQDDNALLKMPEVQAEKTLLGYKKPKAEPEVSSTGQAPFMIPPIYDGHRLLAYRLFDHKEVPTGMILLILKQHA